MREGVGEHLNCYPLLTSERLIATSIYSMTCYFAYFFARILDRLWSMTSSRLHRLIYAKLTHFHQKVASFHVVGSWLGILCKWQIIKTFPTLFLNFVDMLTCRLNSSSAGHAGSFASSNKFMGNKVYKFYYDCFIRIIDNYDKSLYICRLGGFSNIFLTRMWAPFRRKTIPNPHILIISLPDLAKAPPNSNTGTARTTTSRWRCPECRLAQLMGRWRAWNLIRIK